MSSINELKKMSEKERALWLLNANAKDLGILLKNYGIKGISNMSKKEKMSMILDLAVENIADEEIEKVMEETKKLNQEINIRRSCGESIEQTLYARYKNKEISYNQMRKVCDKYNLDIPLSFDEKSSIELIDGSDEFSRKLHSEYEHYNYDYDCTYYSLFDELYQWYNMCRKYNMCEDEDWDLKQFYVRNTVDDNGYLQLAYAFNDDGHYVLCVYKHYELLATYEEGCMEDIEDLAVYDYRLDDDDLYTYKELFESLGKQYEEHCEIMYTDEILRKKLNCTEKNRELIIEELNRSKC